jgi:hypothetical protein
MAAVDRKIAWHLKAMDEADRQEDADVPERTDVPAAVEKSRTQRDKLQQQAEELSAQWLKQLVTTEREARLMRTAIHGHQVAYNAQIAVDAEKKLIVLGPRRAMGARSRPSASR